MQFEPTEIADVILIRPTRFTDDRGHFSEVFNATKMANKKIIFLPVQENQSLSKIKGTVRGLHFQRAPHIQAKLIRVLRGSIFDVAVDIRLGSPTYGKWVGAKLTSAEGEQLFIPGGFAHGFCTLEPDTEVAYLVDCQYAPECDAAIHWTDPTIAIEWPDFAGASVSEKDGKAQNLSDLAPPFRFERGR